jgi:hypothetical protein
LTDADCGERWVFGEPLADVVVEALRKPLVMAECYDVVAEFVSIPSSRSIDERSPRWR